MIQLIYLVFCAGSAITSGLVLLAMALNKTYFLPYLERQERCDV